MSNFRMKLFIAMLLTMGQMLSAQIYHLDLDLVDAVGKGDDLEARKALQLWVEYNNGEWKPVAGRAEHLSNGNHYGRVIEGSITDDKVTLKLDIQVNRTEYIPGGRGEYECTLERHSDNTLTGTYTGRYFGHNFVWRYRDTYPTGSVTGRIEGPIEKDPGWKEITSGEHPRMLFRKEDVPYLAAKLQTDFGKVAFTKMMDATGFGIKYQLTGDVKHAETAKRHVELHMADYNNGSGSGRFGWAPRWEQIVMAYDLCYDAWPEDFRKEVQDYIEWMSYDMYGMYDAWGGGEMSYELLGHASVLYQTMGMAGLAMVNDPSDEPKRPTHPFGDSLDVPTIEPLPADFIPPEDVPVVQHIYTPMEEIHRFKNCTMPGYWIYVAGLHPQKGEDPFESMGGIRNARPRPGDQITCNGETETFKLTEPEHFFSRDFCDITLDLTALTNREFLSTSYLFAYIRNDVGRFIEFNTGGYKHPEWLPYANMYINGVKRKADDFAYVKKGTYAVMLECPIKWCQPHGKIFTSSRWVEPADYRKDLNVELRLEEYKYKLADWEEMKKDWSKTKQHQYMKELYYRGATNMRWYIRNRIERDNHFPNVTAWKGIDKAAVRYVSCYRNVAGEPLNPFIDWYAKSVNEVMKNVTYDDNESPSTWYAPLYSVIPDDMKDDFLDGWNKAAGVTNLDNPAEVLVGGESVIASYAFVNYPLEGVDVSKAPSFRNASAIKPTIKWNKQKGVLTVSSLNGNTPFTLDIYTLRGAVVARYSSQGNTKEKMSISLNHVLSSGVYIAALTPEAQDMIKTTIAVK